jgi:hypothetical protein
MNDPHVQALYYRVEHGEHVDYTKTKPLAYAEADFDIEIKDRRVAIALKIHFASINDARASVEPFLRAWEMDAALRYGPRTLIFRYDRADVIDRNPTPGGHSLVAEPLILTVAGGSVKLVIGLANFPSVPVEMARDASVDLMFERYVLYRDGGTTLADAAYYCLTVVERAADRRAAAAKKFAIQYEVLNKLGELSANKGGARARKVQGSTAEFTGSERQWLEEAMISLIRRAAEFAYDPNAMLRQITMADLPQI